jgi:hypothetical protein
LEFGDTICIYFKNKIFGVVAEIAATRNTKQQYTIVERFDGFDEIIGLIKTKFLFENNFPCIVEPNKI